MTHFIVLVHNQISEFIFKHRLAEEKSGHKLTLFPYKNYNDKIIEALTDKFLEQQPEHAVIIAEANYGDPGGEEINERLFEFLKKTFPKARIIAHSCTVASLVEVLKREPTLEVMLNGDGENDTIELKRQIKEVLHARILKRSDIFAMVSSTIQISSDSTNRELAKTLTFQFDQLSVTQTGKDEIDRQQGQKQRFDSATKPGQCNKLIN